MKASGRAPGTLRPIHEMTDALKRPLSRQFRAKKGLIAFANGTIEAGEWELRPSDPADGLVYRLPYSWEPSAPLTEWTSLTERLLGEDGHKERAALRMHIGLALLGDTTFHRAIHIRGAPDSGKTTILRVANMLQGMEPDHGGSGLIFSGDQRGDTPATSAVTGRWSVSTSSRQRLFAKRRCSNGSPLTPASVRGGYIANPLAASGDRSC